MIQLLHKIESFDLITQKMLCMLAYCIEANINMLQDLFNRDRIKKNKIENHLNRECQTNRCRSNYSLNKSSYMYAVNAS